MKRTLAILCAIIVVCFSACFNDVEKEQKLTADDLTSSQQALIDMVYRNMSIWEVQTKRNDVLYDVNKIAFYNFSSDKGLAFYISWDVPGYNLDFGYAYGSGYFVSNDEMIPITSATYSGYEDETIHEGWLARVSYDGYYWDAGATDEEKYQKIVDAFLEYIN